MSFKVDKLGENIKKFREMRNFTQDYVAKKLEMTSQGYGRIERNEVEITIQKLYTIASILNTTIQDIVNFNDNLIFNNQQVHQKNETHYTNNNLQELKSIYEQLIKTQEKEITYLRSLLEKTFAK